MAREREAAQGAKVLPEFAKFSRIGQSIAGKVVKFDENDNGEFVTFGPVLLRDKPGGEWHRYNSLAVGLTTDIKRKMSEVRTQDVGKWFLFQFVDEEPTTRGSNKKIFKVLELEPAEIDALQKKGIDKQKERDENIQRSGGSVIPPLFPEPVPSQGASTTADI